MTTSGLSSLPTEIILQIFVSADDFTSIANLSGTSRQFNIILKASLARVCNAILPRVVECYDQARELCEAQIEVAVRYGAGREIVDDFQNVVRRYRDDAVMVRKGIDSFTSDWQDETFGNSEDDDCTSENTDDDDCKLGLTSYQRRSFITALYRGMKLATLAESPMPWSMIISLDLLELKRIHGIIYWCTCLSLETFPNTMVYTRGMLEVWTTCEAIAGLQLCFPTGMTHMAEMLHEDYPEIAYSGAGVSLAKLLPK